MRKSFLRMIVISVLSFWSAGTVLLWLYSYNVPWTLEKAQKSGVYLVFDLLKATPQEARPQELERLSEHFHLGFALRDLDRLSEATAQRVRAEGKLIYRESPSEYFFFGRFPDADQVLIAGPVHPALPSGAFPVGVIIGAFGLPVIAGLFALRLEKGVSQVEEASRAFADGELSTRVQAPKVLSPELAANFNAMADRIEELIRNRDELVQAVSHELGSPLSRLRFHLEFLADDVEEPHDERLQVVNRELDALEELVSELLTYVQSDSAVVSAESFEPRHMLSDLAELIALDADTSDGLEVEVIQPDSLQLCADKRLFQRVVENLLRNASRYAQSAILLEVRRDGENVLVIVHDDGPGVPVELQERVTAPFFRVESDRGRSSGGVGLGLAIVSRIMTQHGGQLEIGTSHLGGAKFVTSWPV